MLNAKLPSTDPAIMSAVAEYFKVLSEVSRLQIVGCLKLGAMNVMEIAEVTGLGQANLSKHLKVLTQAGILTRQPKGTSAFYEIADPIIFELCELVCDRISKRMLQQAESLKSLRNKALF
jgi:DNA-binding transcriptional ArsR family regulator